MNEEIKSTINKVKQSRNISLEQLKLLLEINDDEGVRFIREEAVKVCQKTYGNQVLIRGLIEFTNFCKNDCYYCGIRRSNSQADRYRLTKEQMLDCCASGYELGFRTFVLQGGEDGYFTDDKICDLVVPSKKNIRTVPSHFPLEKNQKKVTNAILTRGRIVICSATRLRTRHITKNSIQRRCLLRIANNACGI